MSSELLINSSPSGTRIAFLKDKRLVECHFEDNSSGNFTVGDIYLGTVKKIVPGLNAAFIDLGYEKDAFLHYLDLGPQLRSQGKYVKAVQSKATTSAKLNGFKLEPEIDKDGKIANVLQKNQQVLVQIVKEPISSKGPRLSCELSLAGRYIVLVPFSNTISVSKKIMEKEERQRLQRLLTSIKPENFGIIIRTVAEGKDVAELDKDLKSLLKSWDDGYQALKTAVPKDKIIGELGRTSSILRDLLNASFDSIQVDTQETYEEIKTFINTIAPDKAKIVKLHNNKQKLFEVAGIERQLKTLFGKSVSLPAGGYLIIEHTEALHVIDVNSGNKSNVETEQERTAINVNLEAVSEVARQLRLRDMGGIIVIDFIDMKNLDNRKLIYDRMKEEMSDDRAKHVILPLSKFGIMQITRQRVRPETNIITLEVCPTCNGTGKISASINTSDRIENNLEFLISKQNEKKIKLVVHPFLYAYYTTGLLSIRMKWFLKYKTWISMEKDSSLAIVDFKFRNALDEDFELNS